jgi:hypothetical protein
VDFPPELYLSENVKNLIRGLLEKDPKRRLGHFAGTREIKCHPWIGWINKTEYITKKIEMPYPVNLDCFNFDSKDITVSANRMLANINATFNTTHNKQTRHSYLSKKSSKILSPYR